MKKLIAILLALVMTLGLCACSVNDGEVSVLWAGAEDHAVIPDSLINAMDRAMYIEKISYKYYAASGDQNAQTKQAENCLANGCSALVVELVDAAAAQTIVDMAKAKNVPVVFFGTAVDQTVVDSYVKCVAVATDEQTEASQFTAMVTKYVLANAKKIKEGRDPAEDDMDVDNDGKISYVVIGEVDLQETAAVKKRKSGRVKKTVELMKLPDSFDSLSVKEEEKKAGLFGGTAIYRNLQTADGKIVEMILVDNDEQAMQTLIALQAKGLNSDKLATCFVPVFTIGADADYKAYVMNSLPADAQERKAYLESVALLADMTALGESEWEKRANGQANKVDEMIFTTLNQIGTGRLNGTVLVDYDAMAEQVAKLTVKLLKGAAVEKKLVTVDYTTYTE